MRQRVSLARALAATTAVGQVERGPGLLLMDEPFAALDAITRDVLQGELLRVWQATGTTVLFVTHDVREAIRLAERVVLLSSRPGTVVREWRVGDGPIELHDVEWLRTGSGEPGAGADSRDEPGANGPSNAATWW